MKKAEEKKGLFSHSQNKVLNGEVQEANARVLSSLSPPHSVKDPSLQGSAHS